jgi:MFS family permease
VVGSGGAFSIYRGLPRPVYTLFAAQVVNGVGIFVFPFLALFLTKRLGWSVAEAGRFMFLASIAYIPGTFLGGRLADRYGRKLVMTISQLLAALCFIPCGFLGDSDLVPWFALANIFFDGVTDPARQAMQIDLAPPERRQAAFSLLYLGHNLGFACGPLLAGYLFYAAPRWLFFGNAAAAMAALSLVVALVPETKPSREAIEASYGSASSEAAHRGGLLSALAARPFLVAYLLITTCFGFVYAQHRFALPLQTTAWFGEGGASLYGGLMTLNAVLVIVLATPVVHFTRRWKPLANVAGSGILFALGFGIVGFARAPLLLYLSTAVWTLGEIVNATNDETYVAAHTPMSHRGRFQSVIPLIGGLGFSLSSPIAGSLIESRGIGFIWPLLAAVGAAAALGLALLGLVEERSRRRGPAK